MALPLLATIKKRRPTRETIIRLIKGYTRTLMRRVRGRYTKISTKRVSGITTLLRLLSPTIIRLRRINIVSDARLNNLTYIRYTYNINYNMLMSLLIMYSRIAGDMNLEKTRLLSLNVPFITIRTRILTITTGLANRRINSSNLMIKTLSIFTRNLLDSFPQRASENTDVFRLTVLRTKTMTIINILNLFTRRATTSTGLISFTNLYKTRFITSRTTRQDNLGNLLGRLLHLLQIRYTTDNRANNNSNLTYYIRSYLVTSRNRDTYSSLRSADRVIQLKLLSEILQITVVIRINQRTYNLTSKYSDLYSNLYSSIYGVLDNRRLQNLFKLLLLTRDLYSNYLSRLTSNVSNRTYKLYYQFYNFLSEIEHKLLLNFRYLNSNYHRNVFSFFLNRFNFLLFFFKRFVRRLPRIYMSKLRHTTINFTRNLTDLSSNTTFRQFHGKLPFNRRLNSSIIRIIRNISSNLLIQHRLPAIVRPIMPMRGIIRHMRHNPRIITLTTLNMIINGFTFLSGVGTRNDNRLLRSTTRALFKLLLHLYRSIVKRQIILITMLTSTTRKGTNSFTFLSFLRGVQIIRLSNRRPYTFLSNLLSSTRVTEHGVTLSSNHLFRQLRQILRVRLVTILNRPMHNLNSFLLHRMVTINILYRKLVSGTNSMITVDVHISSSTMEDGENKTILHLNSGGLFLINHLICGTSGEGLYVYSNMYFLSFTRNFLASSLHR